MSRSPAVDPAPLDPPNPAVPRQRRKEARPQELLDAALQLFGEKGFAATRTDDVAERAGVSKGTLYLYYPSKEELLKAVISQRLSVEIAAVAAYVDAYEGPTTTLLTEVLPSWWQAVFDSPTSAIFKIVITEVRNFPELGEFYSREFAEPGKQLVARMLERGMANGEFRKVDVPSAVLSLIMPLIMLCLHKHSLGACSALPPEVDPKAFIQAPRPSWCWRACWLQPARHARRHDEANPEMAGSGARVGAAGRRRAAHAAGAPGRTGRTRCAAEDAHARTRRRPTWWWRGRSNWRGCSRCRAASPRWTARS